MNSTSKLIVFHALDATTHTKCCNTHNFFQKNLSFLRQLVQLGPRCALKITALRAKILKNMETDCSVCQPVLRV